MMGALAVGERLASRIPTVVVSSSRCGESETIARLLIQCMFPNNVWRLAPLKEELFLTLDVSFTEVWRTLQNLICLPPRGISFGPLAPWICWNLWIARNKKIFNGRDYTAEEMIA